MKRRIGRLSLDCVEGDITRQPDFDVIVNAANRQLAGGGGVDGAIHRAAGPRLLEASRSLGPIATGEAVITDAFDLPNRYVVHCVGPVYDRQGPVADQLASAYRRSLALADAAGATSIAFPAVSAGVYGYPLDEAADVAVAAVVAAVPALHGLERLRFVLFSGAALAEFERALTSI